jgi:hypothetical protein
MFFRRLRTWSPALLYPTLVFLVLAGCGGAGTTEPRQAEADTVTDTTAAPVQTAATRAMVRELDQLYRETLANPPAYYYLNREHAARIREQAASQGGAMPPPMRRAYAAALLNAGDTEAAIEQLEGLRDDLGNDAYRTRAGKELMTTLGIAYLRLGEQQNCIANPTAAACILPHRVGLSAVPRHPRAVPGADAARVLPA